MKPQERHDAIFASKVEPTTKLLLMAVASYLTDGGGVCFASPERRVDRGGRVLWGLS